jgi:sugar phosphate isomerase/epimerase
VKDDGIRIAFSTIACPDYTFAQVADAARRFGYDGVELYALEGQRLTPGILSDRLDEARHALSGIPIVSINSWATLSNPNLDERRIQEHQVARTFELANALHSPLVKVFGGEFPADREREEVLAYMAESLWRLAERAGDLGVTLVVETHDGFCRGADLGNLLSRVEHPRIGALWDVHHPYRMGETPEQTDRLIGGRVAHAHVKDAVRIAGGWRFVPLGEGELPVRAQLACLQARAFSGYVAVDWEKMWHPEIDGPDQALPQHIAVLREYIGSTS